MAVVNFLAAAVAEEQPGLVIAGKQATDNDMNATGQLTKDAVFKTTKGLIERL